jgi:hypothetical protein
VCHALSLAEGTSLRTVRVGGTVCVSFTVRKSRIIAAVSCMPGHTSYRKQPHLHDRPHV